MILDIVSSFAYIEENTALYGVGIAVSCRVEVKRGLHPLTVLKKDIVTTRGN